MIGLDLPDHGVKTKQGPQGPQVFDPVRRLWVALTPEEWTALVGRISPAP